jgi:heptosyltransferase III
MPNGTRFARVPESGPAAGGGRRGGNILVVRGGAIGDFVLTLPAMAALRARFPDAHIEVLGYPHIVQLAVAGGLVDQARSIEAGALAGFFARGGKLAPELADYFSDFDLILSYLYDPDGIFQENVGLCSPAQFIAGPHRPTAGEPLPAAEVFLKPLARLAIFEADTVPRLRIGDAPGPGNGPEGVPVLAMHPGSGSERKNWPESRWRELLQEVAEATGWRVLLVGGEAEGSRLERLARVMPAERLRLAQSLPLAELGQQLQAASGFVGHDSGISHLAAALGLPGLVLWGDSVEAVWRPPSSRVSVVRWPAGLAQLPVSEVLQRLRTLGGGLG